MITFDSIALGAVNTSFYRLKGAPFTDNNLTVNLLLGEVYVIQTDRAFNSVYVYMCLHESLGAIVYCTCLESIYTSHTAIEVWGIPDDLIGVSPWLRAGPGPTAIQL